MQYEDDVFSLKLIVVGDSGVGKTALSECYVHGKKVDDKSDNNNYDFTIGVEFYSKFVDSYDKHFKLQMWDTAGQERYQAITKSYYRNTAGTLLCFAINNKNSFKNLSYYLEELNNYASYIDSNKDIRTNKIILVGTFSDKRNEKNQDIKDIVSINDINEFATKNGLKYIETSSKTGEGVNKAFNELLRQINEEIDDEALEVPSGDFDSDYEFDNYIENKVNRTNKIGFKCCKIN